MFICEYCGTMLLIDSDLDTDRYIETAKSAHQLNVCPQARAEFRASAEEFRPRRSSSRNAQSQ